LDVHEALFTTRMMRRVHLDPIVLETRARILDVAIQASNGGNTQGRNFLAAGTLAKAVQRPGSARPDACGGSRRPFNA
jgi:hypothetical protein